MNYRHGYHAGNFADVVKHVALVAILAHLQKKDAPFAVIDSHAGRGRYDLAGAQARKTDEAAGGIERLRGAVGITGALAQYLDLVAGESAGHYPGSPLLAARMLRPQDRLVAVEKHPEEAALLQQVLSPWRKASVELADGYARLPKLLPPPERRGLVLIDPPFEAIDEFEQLAATLRAAWRRFATGIFLVWYPVKSRSAAEAFVAEVLSAGMEQALTLSAEIDAPEGKLARADLLVLNPPFGFAARMAECLDVLAPALGTKGAISWRAGGE